MPSFPSSPRTPSPRTPRRHRLLAALAGALVVTALAGCTPTASVSLPKGFPTAVPVASQELTASGKTGAAWNVTVKVADAAAQQAALTKLTTKGFAVIGSAGAGDRKSYSLADATYSVRVGFERDGDDYLVTYGVAPRGGADR